MSRKILDADSILYHGVFSGKEDIEQDGYLIEAINIEKAFNWIVDLVDSINPDIIALTDSRETFRKKLFPSYKGNRDLKRQSGVSLMRTKIKEHYQNKKVVSHDFIEADDLVSMYVTSENDVVYSIDKDLIQIPCNHVCPFTQEVKYHDQHLIWLQVLMGDAADGIPGIKGVGIKTAEKIIGDGKNAWGKIVDKYGNEQDALNTYWQVKLLERDNINLSKGLILLRHPVTNEVLREVKI